MRPFILIPLVLLVVGLSYFIFVTVQQSLQSQTEVTENTPQTDPGNGQAIIPLEPVVPDNVTQSLTTNSGRDLVVNSFSQVDRVTDVGSNMYHLSTDSYDILFNDSNDSFAINIAEKPILSTRDRAVRDLATILGVSAFQLCDLNVYISTTKEFDPASAGTDLGLGICAN